MKLLVILLSSIIVINPQIHFVILPLAYVFVIQFFILRKMLGFLI